MEEVAATDKRMYSAVWLTDEEGYSCTMAAGTIYVQTKCLSVNIQICNKYFKYSYKISHSSLLSMWQITTFDTFHASMIPMRLKNVYIAYITHNFARH